MQAKVTNTQYKSCFSHLGFQYLPSIVRRHDLLHDLLFKIQHEAILQNILPLHIMDLRPSIPLNLYSYNHHSIANPFSHILSDSSVVQLCLTIYNPMDCSMQASLSITNSQSLFKLMSIKSVMPFNHLILCHPLLLLPSIFPSSRVFFNELVLCIRWPKYWIFSFSISLSNEYSGLTSFRIDWLDLLGVQGTLKSLLQHHSSKASILHHSAFFIV